MYSSSKSKIDPMNMDFDFMIKNHPEFFTKLLSQNFDYPPSLPPQGAPSCVWGYSGLADWRQPSPQLPGRGCPLLRRVGSPGATLQPRIYPPTLMRNPKPKRGCNNFFN
jgi:hypothetical protein